MKEMDDIKSKLCRVEKVTDCLLSAVEFATSQGVFSKEVDTHEMGEVIDMVKDGSEIERNYWEACYYKSVVTAMDDYGDEDDNGRRGYNSNRYKNGRFAPSGQGSYGYDGDGFMPYMMENPGYNQQNRGNGSSNRSGNMNNGSYGYNNQSRYSRMYDEYVDARRHYHDTKSSTDKEIMDQKALEHVNGSIVTLKDIWKDADPSVQKEVKKAIRDLADEFERP